MKLESVNKNISTSSNETPVISQVISPKVPVKFIHPFPLITASSDFSLLEKEFSLGSQSKNEITQLMDTQEQEIERVISQLKLQKAKTSLIESGLGAKGAALELVNQARDKSLSAMKYLESILPNHIVGDPNIASRIQESYSVMELSQVIQNALDSGLTGLAQIYKGKLLEESEKILKDVTESYEKNHEKLPPAIKEWEKRIIKEREGLNASYKLLGLTAARRGMALLKLPAVMNALPFNTSLLSKGIKITGPVIGFIFSAISYKSKENGAALYDEWVKKYEAWKEKTEKGGDIRGLEAKEAPTKLISAQKIAEEIHLPRKHYRKEFDRLIGRTLNIQEIRSVLKQCDVELDPSVKTKERFIHLLSHQPGFKKQILSSYIYYRETMIKMTALAQHADNLIVKREALVEKKILQLKPRFEELKDSLMALNKFRFEKNFQNIVEEASSKGTKLSIVRDLLQKMGLTLPASIKSSQDALQYLNNVQVNPSEKDMFYKKWFLIQPKESLLKTYIDHQETLEQTTKNALKEMVTKKQELDGKFIKTQLFESRTFFTLSTASFVLSSVLGILALVGTLPLAGAPLLITALSMSSTWLGYGFMSLGKYMSYKYKNSSYNLETYFENISLRFNHLFVQIHAYNALAKEKKLKETEEIVGHLQKVYKKDKTHYEKALVTDLEKYKLAKAEYEESQKKLNHWKEKGKKLEESLASKAWKDYAHFADLKIDETEKCFDTLRSLEQALQKLDISLLDSETRIFLESQLGMDLNQIQKEMKKNPAALKEALKHIFVMDENKMGYFIEMQQEKMKAGLIRK